MCDDSKVVIELTAEYKNTANIKPEEHAPVDYDVFFEDPICNEGFYVCGLLDVHFEI